MRVCLINPPLAGKGSIVFVPLGLAYLASTLRDNDQHVSIADFQVDTEETVLHSAVHADVVGITSMSCNFGGAQILAQKIKQEAPDIPVIMGGPHVTFTDTEALKNPAIDIIVRHEGEYTLREVVSSLERGTLSEVTGITYREKGRIKRNPSRPFITNLDALPFPARDLLKTEHYYTGGGMPRIISGRGCPHQCIFCAASSLWGRTVRLRSPENVVDELEHIIASYHLSMFGFDDDTFTIVPEHTRGICHEIIDRGLDVKWGCNVRVDTLTEDTLILMKKAGCFSLFVGVESGNQKTLDLMNKRITLSQIENAVALAKKHSIEVILTGILGFPTETYKDVQNTINFMVGLKGYRYLFNFLMIYPGTELERRQEELHLNPIENLWERVEATPNQIPAVETEYLSISDLSRLYVETNLKVGRLYKGRRFSKKWAT
jgi:anaerobic magnesium-protoporphyrin IX monomethyl ester cyclase